jgi:diphthine methyl ester synthase
MTLFIIGLGLGDEKDITVRGLEAVKSCDKIFLEAYTSILGVDKERLEAFYGASITVADRNMVESEAEQIYEPAKTTNVALLVVGDPVCATTHTDILIRAKEFGCKVQVIHNASIMGAAGSSGLQLYNFGHTVSICFFEENWRPTSFYPKILYNRQGGMHTLCLLDIKVKEPDFDAMMKGRTVYLPPRYMTVNQCCENLIEAEERHQNGAYSIDTTLCIGMARLGQETQCIKAGTMQELIHEDFGGPLHSVIICGDLHDLELEVVQEFLVQGSKFSVENATKIEQQIVAEASGENEETDTETADS